jgi:hypothetical protein
MISAHTIVRCCLLESFYENVEHMITMNEYDVLKSIAENLSERKTAAALSNYEVLCSNIQYVNDLLGNGLVSFSDVQRLSAKNLEDDSKVRDELKDDSKPLFYFRNIVPRILTNGISICEKLKVNTLPDDRAGITVKTIRKLVRGFIDYNNLVTSARQYIDSLISDSYQLVLLDPKSLNYHVLLSLNSFNKYVTKSIRQALFNKDIEDALKEFEKLKFKEWVNSPITRCAHNTFAKKVDYLFTTLNIVGEDDFKDEVKNLFKFSSEFTHIGYISTLFTSSDAPEFIFAGEVSPYLPSTENFSELKYEILGTALKFYYTVYLPSVICSFNKLFESTTSSTFETDINSIISNLKSKFIARNSEYIFFIREGLIDSREVIDLTCMCRVTRHWKPPHENAELFCKNCGSKFRLIVLEGDPGYIITDSGPIKVIGSSAPDFRDLPPEQQQALLEKVKEMNEK